MGRYCARILLTAVIILSTVTLAQAEEAQVQKKLGVTLDVSYWSKWLTKGCEGYGSKGVFFETIDLDMWGSGFGVSVTHQSANGSGYIKKERFNNTIYYGSTVFEDAPYAMKYRIDWTYKYYPNVAGDVSATQEWILKTSWPKILGVDGLAPYYTAYYEYPSGRDQVNRYYTGWAHLFGLGYDMAMPGLQSPLRLFSDVMYKDGLGSRKGHPMDHDWSHATFGISTKFNITENLSFSPELDHQITMDDSTSTHKNITYCKLSMKYKF
jgi:hypothetical protein